MSREIDSLKSMGLSELLADTPDLPVEFTDRLNAEAKLSKLKVPPVTPPVEDETELKYPADLSSIGDLILGTLYGKYMSWQGYCRYLLNLKEADVLLVNNMLGNVKKTLKREIHELPEGTRMTVEAKRDFVECHPVVAGLEKVLTRFEIERSIVNGRFCHFEACAKALSREISRREMENSKNRI